MMRDLTADDMPTFGELTDEERGALIRLEREGKTIQCFQLPDHGWWYIGPVEWKWDERYRAKPEPRKPREWWVHPDTHNWSTHDPLDIRYVHVREVIEND